MTTSRRFKTTLRRIAGKGGWTYVSVPKKLTPPITRAWARTPRARVAIGFGFDEE